MPFPSPLHPDTGIPNSSALPRRLYPGGKAPMPALRGIPASIPRRPRSVRLNNFGLCIFDTNLEQVPSKIFHGRDLELTQIAQMLIQQCAKIAILGPGGIGKTNLARAALHHPGVAAKYTDRLFVSCESATTSIEIAAVIGAQLGLKPGKNLTKSVLHSLAKKSICLLILDNLETTWEPLDSRSGTEDLLSSLTDIPHLALMVTMRGVEHPAKVRWTRPFLPPLAPLSLEAAQKMFRDIAEDYHDPEDIDQLLKFTDNMPLAVDLMAHLVAFEGCSLVLARLQSEKTSVLSEGADKRSNLDTSIALSLSSPRLTVQTGAMDLLQLLSILPDGLSDVELIQSNLVIPQIRACKSVLIGTSLAYLDNKKRLKSLVPIREYLQCFHPVAPAIVLPLQTYFQSLLGTYKKYQGSNQVTNISFDSTKH
ncbi:AAA domain-containing protein [Mycena sanguinolenta]|uniref:AAA domain-containing protein n=1 Tax=Mycena sanguinolenta TaxID=230812 RepID=A0A8H7D0D4_9AGAR|nr:AAA domain-containing protein [Mycena sanguinolenta]